MCDQFNMYTCDLLTPTGMSDLKINVEEHREKECARAPTRTNNHTRTHTIGNKFLVD